MAVYRQVMLSFWTDSFIDDYFSAEDKYFYLYILTNTHTTLCGCYEVSEQRMGKEMGLSTETVMSIIDRFSKTYDLIRYNHSTKEILILKWSKYNWNASPRFRVAVENELEKIKDYSFKQYLALLLDGEEINKSIYPIDTVMSENASHENPIDTNVIVNVNDTVSVNSNSLEDKPVKETKRTRKKYEDTPEFKAFWDAYPVHANKVGAREAFAKADAPLEVLLEAIETWKRTDQWNKEGGRFIPYPAKWLKERRWEDSPKVNMPKSDGMERYRNLQRLAEEFDGE